MFSTLQFFKVSVQQGGENISEADLCSQLSRVLKMAEERNQAQEVGILTSQARHTWAEHRARLMQGDIFTWECSPTDNIFACHIRIQHREEPMTYPERTLLKLISLHDISAQSYSLLHLQCV